MKKIISKFLSVLVCAVVCSGCGDPQPKVQTETATEIMTTSKVTTEQTTIPNITESSEITSEPTKTSVSKAITTQETTARKLTVEEIELMNEMPEIVFVFSHYRYAEQNIIGFFVTKNGDVKMYDFRNKEEAVFDVTNVIDELETVICDELESYTIINSEDLKSIPEYKMIEYYKTLLQIDENSEIIIQEKYTDNFEGIGKFYGIRYNQNGEREIITLTGWGYFYDVNTDPLSESIAIYNVLKDIPYKLYY